MGAEAVTGVQEALAGLSPDAAVLLLTAGTALIWYELNRPGSVVPGALGLLTVLLSGASLGRAGLNPIAVALILSAVALLTLGLVRPTPMLLSMAATVALIAGLRWLPEPGCCVRVHMPVAAGCGAALGAGSRLLTGIARRARVNKGVSRKASARV